MTNTQIKELRPGSKLVIYDQGQPSPPVEVKRIKERYPCKSVGKAFGHMWCWFTDTNGGSWIVESDEYLEGMGAQVFREGHRFCGAEPYTFVLSGWPV